MADREACRGGAKPQDGGGDLFGSAEASDGFLGDHLGVPLGGARADPLDHLGVDDPGADGVDPDTLVGVLEGGGLGEANDGVLGGGVGGLLGDPCDAGAGGGVDDCAATVGE